MKHLLTLALLTATCGMAQEHKLAKRIWRVSEFVTVGASAYDASQSWHGRESNPILASNGRFGAKGLSIKAGLTFVQLICEHKLQQGDDTLYAPMSLLNFATAGGFVAAGTIHRH